VWYALGLTLVLEAHLTAAILYWPEFARNAQALRAMIPPIARIKQDFDKLIEGGVFGYVAGQHFFKFGNLVGTVAAVVFAAGAVAGEAHRGTLEIWLARPVSRVRILSERWVQGALALVAPLALSTLTIPWLLGKVDQRCDFAPLALSFVHFAVFLLCIYGFTFFLSTLSRTPLVIIAGMIFAALLELALYLVEGATQWSMYRLADMDRLLAIQKTGALDPRYVAGLSAFVVATYVASLIAFRRRTP
jgi:ABC-2 type transport system permease protein